MEKKIEVYYDGLCVMCRGAMRTVEHSSKGGAFQAMDVAQGVLPPGIDENGALHNMHTVDASGRVYVGIDGILRIIEEYPKWRWFARVGKLWGIRHALYALYRIVAAQRRRFNSIVK